MQYFLCLSKYKDNLSLDKDLKISFKNLKILKISL